MENVKITCLSIDCPERKSLCCGAISQNKNGKFVCSKCGEPYVGGECNATVDPNLMVELFLRESNAIEGIYDEKSLKQAITAWHYLVEQPKLDGGVILKTHKILMLHQPLQPNEKGFWRRCDVRIGNREGVEWRQVPDCMAQWLAIEKGVESSQTKFIEEWIKQAHIQYEEIHPFVDGNGRTGRMFMNWRRLKMGLPLLIIFADDKQGYYDWFK